MARLIVKSPYIKCGGGQNASGYLQYIATRERVEIVPDDRPPTRKQEQLIQKLVKDFPETKELLEYDDYKNAPTISYRRERLQRRRKSSNILAPSNGAGQSLRAVSAGKALPHG